jgi:DNA-binding MarR family transcriptional regulator
MKAEPQQVAAQVLEVVPLIMRAIRSQMRAHRRADLTVTQFRVLAFIDRHTGASLSDVGDHIGLALPSMSKMIDVLVARKLVARKFDLTDRRRVTLALTARGRAILQGARDETRAVMTQTFATCSAPELQTIAAAMELLRPLFLSEREVKLARRGNHEHS